MNSESKGEENYIQVNIDDLQLEIKEELKNIKNIKKTLQKLSKENHNNQEFDFSDNNRTDINSEFVLKKYSFQQEIFIENSSLREHLAHVFEIRIKESQILRKAIKETGIDISLNSSDLIKFLLDDLTILNNLFGILNENGVQNIKELAKFYVNLYNNPKNGKYKLLKFGNFSNSLKNFLCPLEKIEAESYTRVLLTKCGVHGITSIHSAEYFLKALIKLHFEHDSLRRHWYDTENHNSFIEVLVKELKGKFSSSNGFDDILLSAFGNNKNTKYSLKTVEMKVGDDLSGFFDYIRANKNSKFTSKICNDIDSFLAIRLKQLINNDIFSNLATKIIIDLSNKYKFTTSGIGYNFNIKVKSGNLRNAIIDAGLSQIKTNQILEGGIKQNQLISLMQHGNAHKMVKKKGYFTIIDEVVHEIEFKMKIVVNGADKFVTTKIHRDFFLPKFVSGENGKLIMKIEGLSSVLQKMNPQGKQSKDQNKAYLKLEGMFKSALKDLKPFEIDTNTSTNEVARKLNEMHQSIYFEIMRQCNVGLFEELSIFDCGRMSHCLETISNLGRKTKNQLLKYFKSKSIVPYTFHQHWQTPYSLDKAFQLKGISGDSSSLNGWLILKNKYIGNLLSNEIVRISDIETVWNSFLEDSNWFQKILRDLPPPYKIPDGFNLNHRTHTVRPLIFFDNQTMIPISVSGYNKKEQLIGIKLDMNKFFDEKPSFSKNLFQFPIKINVRGVEFSQSDEIVETWKKRLIYSGVPEEQVDLLGTQYNFRNADGYFNVKILFAIIFEYKQIWCDFAEWIQEYIQSVNDWTNILPSSVDSDLRHRFRVNNEHIQFDYTGNSDWDDVLLGIGSRVGENTWSVRKESKRTFVFPSQNKLFNKLIDDIQHQIWKLIPESPQEIPEHEIWDYIISNWNSL
ncbi:MAG: hypothetical protein ACTSO5_11445 [Candidatus Heimdallarchaeaceae archaeon]